MISGDDIDAFAESSGEAIAQAVEFARRKDKNIPPDRWATTRQMYLVADGIKALMQISAWQTEALARVIEATTGGPDGHEAD